MRIARPLAVLFALGVTLGAGPAGASHLKDQPRTDRR